MKKWTIVPAILLACCALISCNKNSNLSKDETAAGLFPPPSPRVKDLTTRSSVTRFYYNSEGGVDSTIQKLLDTITISTIIYGKGHFIDSIHKYRQGYLTHKWNNIKYNSAAQITEFTRWYDESNNDYAKYLLRYDNHGNMIEQKIVTPETTWVQNTFVYNLMQGLTSHSYWLFHWEQEWKIKSDSLLNPFHKMPHLFIIAESPDEQQQQLNKYNSIERVYVPSGYILNWLNEYDQYDRLIKKTSSESQYDWFTLTYY